MSREEMLLNFKAICREWERDNNRTTEGFSSILRLAMPALNLTARDIADKCEVSEAVVGQWASGAARPTPRVQSYVIDQLQGMAHF